MNRVLVAAVFVLSSGCALDPFAYPGPGATDDGGATQDSGVADASADSVNDRPDLGAYYSRDGGCWLADPGALAFACVNDVPCGTHHCNPLYGFCAFPCQTACDCIAPDQCISGLCVPHP